MEKIDIYNLDVDELLDKLKTTSILIKNKISAIEKLQRRKIYIIDVIYKRCKHPYVIEYKIYNKGDYDVSYKCKRCSLSVFMTDDKQIVDKHYK